MSSHYTRLVVMLWLAVLSSVCAMHSPVKKRAAFFDELLKDKDPELVKRISTVVGGEPLGPGVLEAHIFQGELGFQVDNVKGWGTYNVTGGGAFQGNTLSVSAQAGGGKFKLWVKSDTAKLYFYDSAGKLLEPVYEGTGAQTGLDTTDDKPWEGNWD